MVFDLMQLDRSTEETVQTLRLSDVVLTEQQSFWPPKKKVLYYSAEDLPAVFLSSWLK